MIKAYAVHASTFLLPDGLVRRLPALPRRRPRPPLAAIMDRAGRVPHP